MFDIKDDAKGAYRRVEVLTGPGRRRSAQEKARIVAESCAPDAVVSEPRRIVDDELARPPGRAQRPVARAVSPRPRAGRR